jgi:hypothetical protein
MSFFRPPVAKFSQASVQKVHSTILPVPTGRYSHFSVQKESTNMTRNTHWRGPQKFGQLQMAKGHTKIGPILTGTGPQKNSSSSSHWRRAKALLTGDSTQTFGQFPLDNDPEIFGKFSLESEHRLRHVSLEKNHKRCFSEVIIIKASHPSLKSLWFVVRVTAELNAVRTFWRPSMAVLSNS